MVRGDETGPRSHRATLGVVAAALALYTAGHLATRWYWDVPRAFERAGLPPPEVRPWTCYPDTALGNACHRCFQPIAWIDRRVTGHEFAAEAELGQWDEW